MEKTKAVLFKIFDFFLWIIKALTVRPAQWFWAQPRSRKWKVVGATLIMGLFAILMLPVLLYLAVAQGTFGQIPSDKELQAIKSYQASEVYSSDSVLLGRYFVENRSDASYEQVNKVVFDAIIATEDARFYEHKGVDTRSLLRVLVKTLILGEGTGGGSTLSQQLVKNLFGRKRYGWLTMPVNKIKEGIIANKLEKLYNKKEILMLYVNTVSFGEDTYGIKTACQRFFSTSPQKIKVEQAAVLAGMLKAPTAYNPRKNPEKSLQRRNVVLGQMQKYGYLTEAEALELQELPITLKYNRMNTADGLAPHFREMIKSQLENWLKDHPKSDGTAYDLYTDGLKIYTTIHSRLQKYAEAAAKEHLGRIQPVLQRDLRANGFFKQNYGLILEGVRKSARYAQLEEDGLSDKEILKELRKPIQMTMFTQWGEKEMTLSPIDSVRLTISSLQVGFLVLNPKNGYVLAWVGSPDFKHFQYDHVTAQRQVGSVFKPIVYAKSLQDGTSPCEFISNQKITYTQYDNWSPKNSEDKYTGNYSLVGALANSVNTISVKLCMKAGIPSVIALARQMGIESELPQKPSLALGTADLSLKELLGAYTVFANDGRKTEMQFITSIQKDAKQLFKMKPQSKQIISTDVAHTMTNMMRSVINKGTAYELRDKYKFSGDIAGKTGTTQEHKDGWFVGYTSKWLGGVWVGADNPAVHFTDMENGKGSRMAMPVWAGFYRRVARDKALRNMVYAPFPYKDDIECEMFKEDGFFTKLFRKRNKNNHNTGFEDEEPVKEKKKRRFRLFGKRS